MREETPPRTTAVRSTRSATPRRRPVPWETNSGASEKQRDTVHTTRPRAFHNARAGGTPLQKGPRGVCRDTLPAHDRGRTRPGGTWGRASGANPHPSRPRLGEMTAVGTPPPLRREQREGPPKKTALGGPLASHQHPPPSTVAATSPCAGPLPCQHPLLPPAPGRRQPSNSRSTALTQLSPPPPSALGELV